MFLYKDDSLGCWLYAMLAEKDASKSCSVVNFAAFEKLDGQSYWLCLYALLTRCLAKQKADGTPCDYQEKAALFYTQLMNKHPLATVVLAYESQRSEPRRKQIADVFSINPSNPNGDLMLLWGKTHAHGTLTMLELAQILGKNISIEMVPDKTKSRLWERCHDIWGGNEIEPSLLFELVRMAENPRYTGLGENLLGRFSAETYHQRRFVNASMLNPQSILTMEQIHACMVQKPAIWAGIIISFLLHQHRTQSIREYEIAEYMYALVAKLAPHVTDNNLRTQMCMLCLREFRSYPEYGAAWLYEALPARARLGNRAKTAQYFFTSFAPREVGNTRESTARTEMRNQAHLVTLTRIAERAKKDPAEKAALEKGLADYLGTQTIGRISYFFRTRHAYGFNVLDTSINASEIVRAAVRQGLIDAESVNSLFGRSGITNDDLLAYFNGLQRNVHLAFEKPYITEYAKLASCLRSRLDNTRKTDTAIPNSFEGPSIAGKLLQFPEQLPIFIEEGYRFAGNADLEAIITLCESEKGSEWFPYFGSKNEPLPQVTDAVWHILKRNSEEFPNRLRMLQIFLGKADVKGIEEPLVVAWLIRQLSEHAGSWKDLIFLCFNRKPVISAHDSFWDEIVGRSQIHRKIRILAMEKGRIGRDACKRAREILTLKPEWAKGQTGFTLGHLTALAQDWWEAIDLCLSQGLLEETNREAVLRHILQNCSLVNHRPELFPDELLVDINLDALREQLFAIAKIEKPYHLSTEHKTACVEWAVRLGIEKSPRFGELMTYYVNTTKEHVRQEVLLQLLC